jgi:hypothetical protein
VVVPVTGTPFTHEDGFAAHHIPAFALEPVTVPDPEPELIPELPPGAVVELPLVELDPVVVVAAFETVEISRSLVTMLPRGVRACQIPPTPWPFT